MLNIEARTSKFGLAILGIICLVFLSVISLLYNDDMKVKADNVSLASQLQTETASPVLPPNAVQISGCVPGEGNHWVVPADIPGGPYYSTYQDKVIAVEYMVTPDQVPGSLQATMSAAAFANYMQTNNLTFGSFLSLLKNGYNLKGYKYQSVDVRWSAPHAGITVPHYDFHFFLVDDKTRRQICPNATAQDAVTPEIIKNLQQDNIPYPGGPTK